MLQTPYWLTNKGVDQLIPEEYDTVRREFMESLATEEQQFNTATVSQLHLSDVMERSWQTGAFWYTLALSSPSGLFTIFDKHIQPLFLKNCEEEFQMVMPFFFEKDIGRIAGRKLADREDYDNNLRQAFDITSD
jgi:hypothetical protein